MFLIAQSLKKYINASSTPQLKRAKIEHIPINALPQQFHHPQTLQQQQQLQQQNSQSINTK